MCFAKLSKYVIWSYQISKIAVNRYIIRYLIGNNLLRLTVDEKEIQSSNTVCREGIELKAGPLRLKQTYKYNTKISCLSKQ